MGGAPASGESSRGGLPSPIKGRSSTKSGGLEPVQVAASEVSASREEKPKCQLRWSPASVGVEVEASGEGGRVSAGEAREGKSVGVVTQECRRSRVAVVSEEQKGQSPGEESQTEALGTTVNGTAAELGGPGGRP